MKGDDRRAAIAAYKKRDSVAGIYAVRCTSSNQVWVGQTFNLDAIQNRVWFSLRMGSSSNRELQIAWRAHGAESFTLEPIERLKEEESSYVRDALLRERAVHWRSTLGALVI
jgi:hypothetical protein